MISQHVIVTYTSTFASPGRFPVQPIKPGKYGCFSEYAALTIPAFTLRPNCAPAGGGNGETSNPKRYDGSCARSGCVACCCASVSSSDSLASPGLPDESCNARFIDIKAQLVAPKRHRVDDLSCSSVLACTAFNQRPTTRLRYATPNLRLRCRR